MLQYSYTQLIHFTGGPFLIPSLSPLLIHSPCKVILIHSYCSNHLRVPCFTHSTTIHLAVTPIKYSHIRFHYFLPSILTHPMLQGQFTFLSSSACEFLQRNVPWVVTTMRAFSEIKSLHEQSYLEIKTPPACCFFHPSPSTGCCP